MIFIKNSPRLVCARTVFIRSYQIQRSGKKTDRQSRSVNFLIAHFLVPDISFKIQLTNREFPSVCVYLLIRLTDSGRFLICHWLKTPHLNFSDSVKSEKSPSVCLFDLLSRFGAGVIKAPPLACSPFLRFYPISRIVCVFSFVLWGIRARLRRPLRPRRQNRKRNRRSRFQNHHQTARLRNRKACSTCDRTYIHRK